MRISTQTDPIFPEFGIDEGMKIFSEAGFDAVDFSMFWMNGDPDIFFNAMSEDELVQKLLAASEKYGKIFTVHQNRRWDPDYLTIKKIYEAGTLGRVFDIESRVHGS